MATDPLRFRRVWITRRKRDSRRRSNYCVNWIDDAGVPHRLSYETMQLARRAQELREAELNRWGQITLSILPPTCRDGTTSTARRSRGQ